MDDSRAFCKKWERYREYGRFKYILIFGILIDNLISIPVFAIVIPLIKYNFDFQQYLLHGFISNTIIGISVGTIVGFVSAYTKWNRNQDRYENIIKVEN